VQHALQFERRDVAARVTAAGVGGDELAGLGIERREEGVHLSENVLGRGPAARTFIEHGIEEGGVAFELAQRQRKLGAVDHRAEQIGDDRFGMEQAHRVHFDETGVAADVHQHEREPLHFHADIVADSRGDASRGVAGLILLVDLARLTDAVERIRAGRLGAQLDVPGMTAAIARQEQNVVTPVRLPRPSVSARRTGAVRPAHKR